MRLLRWIIPTLAAALILSAAGRMSAQANDAISGTVTDAQTGDPIQGALVEIGGADTLLSAEIGVDGTYQIPDVPPGEYSVTASAAGYENGTREEVDVPEGEGAQVDFSLQLSEAEVSPVLISATDGDEEEGKQPGDHKGYVGTFSLGDGFFTVATRKEDVVVRIPDGGLELITRLPGQAPTGEAGGSTAEGLVDGAEVAVLVEFLLEEGSTDLVLEARQIMVKPNPEPPVVGAVVSVGTNEEGVRTLTIMRPNGTTKEVRLGADADAPEIGEVVTAFHGRGSRGQGREDGDDGEPPTVTGLVSAEQVLQRLEGFLEDLTSDDGNLPSQVAERRAEQVAQVAAILEGTHPSTWIFLKESTSGRTCRLKRYWAC